ncbi:nitroreductase family protein [Microbacterium esteraromaticum]|uniref:nitroreductase family protein n=1 Tax=Microbacterium esteraromaticum TaxID=57043 RepID=UPI001A8EBE46|nr:nitroreductase family protein [Microbacterium esteraromaticum]MBN8425581.1 nitroreductase family protein [Microbacterium esteraromaticum]
MSAREAALARTSWSKVTEAAPTRDELVPLIEAAGRVADHSSLRPWRLIELRGDDRLTLGAALAEAAGDDKPSTKPLRASLLIAIVASYRKTDKVPRWEQEAVASGVAHTLSLLLDEAGWGVIWRTGGLTRAEAVARAHGLHENEELLGWLYVGGKPEGKSAGRRKPVDVDTVLTRMPDAGHDGDERPPTSTDKKKSKKKKHKKKSKKD